MAPSPPAGCAPAPAARMPHPVPALGPRALLRVTALPLGWLLGRATFSADTPAPAGGQQESGENKLESEVHQPILLLGLLARSLPSFHPNSVCPLRSPSAEAGGPCARAVICCISTDCTCKLCSPTPGHMSLQLPEYSQAVKTCPRSRVTLDTAGHGDAGNNPTGRKASGSTRTSEHHSLSTAAKAGTALAVGHTAPSLCAAEKPLQQCQHQLWPLKKGLLEVPNFRGSL